MQNFSHLTEIIIEAVLAGKDVALQYFKSDTNIDIKTKEHSRDFVTKADTEVQATIEQTILQLMLKSGYNQNEIGFLGEEGLVKSGRFTFIIDPIDGTKNFISGLDIFGISIALYQDNQPISAIICAPAYNKLYLAEKGKGAWMINREKISKLKVEPCSLNNAVINFDVNSSISSMKGVRESMISELSPLVRTIRMVGSSTIETCWTAENIFNFAIFARQKAWDIAAGKIILEEAGGTITDWCGMNFNIDPTDGNKKYFAVAAEKNSLRQILPYLDISSLNNIFD